MRSEEARAKAAAIAKEKELQHKKEFYKANRERLLAKMKEYNKTHREDMYEREKLYKNFDRVQYCKLMIKRWEKKLKEAEMAEQEDKGNVAKA